MGASLKILITKFNLPGERSEKKKKKTTIFKSGFPVCLKRKDFDECILPVLTYASETWTLTSKTLKKFQITQKSMER